MNKKNKPDNLFKTFNEKLKDGIEEINENDLIGKPKNEKNPDEIKKYLAFYFAKNSKMKINQLRKLFTMIKNFYEKNKKDNEINMADLIKLYPVVAYSKGRNLLSDEEAKVFYLLFDKLKDNLTKASLEKFYSFFQAVIAYRKYLGG